MSKDKSDKPLEDWEVISISRWMETTKEKVNLIY
jgi:hypothetical protein